MDIGNILISGDVERFHQCVGMAKQRNSEHQWGVALLVHHFDKSARKEVILAALTHDAPELITGDIPAITKWSRPEIRTILEGMERDIEGEWGICFELTKLEKHLLKICDMFEGMQYCIKRRKMGELKASIPFHAWVNHIREKWLPLTARDIHMTSRQEEFFNNLTQQMYQLENNYGG